MEAWPYWIPFFLLSFSALIKVNEKQAVRFVGGVLIILIGFRYEVGGDWNAYLRMVEEAKGASVSDALFRTDPAYGLLNWIGANWFGGIYFVNFVCALLSVGSLVHFCNRQINPSLALLVAIPFIATVIFAGLTRQGVAIGLGMLAMLAIQERRIWRYFKYSCLAILFHKTAVCLIFLSLTFPLIDRKWRSFWAAIFLIAITILLVSQFYGEKVDYYLNLYIDSAGETGLEEGKYSSGAVIRGIQSVFAVGIFLIIIYFKSLDRKELVLWAAVSAVIMALFVAAFWRSTLADRFGYYFIPLQLYAFSTFPILFAPVSRLVVKACVAVACGLTLGVWLSFGQHAVSWLPYKTVLLQWL